MTTSSNAKFYTSSVAITPICSLKIDKIVVTLQVKDAEEKEGIALAVMCIAKDKEFGGFVNLKNKRYRYAACIITPSAQRVLIEAGPFRSKDPAFRMTWNPSKLTGEDIQYVKVLLETMLPFGYAQLFDSGRVSRLDIAFDILGRDLGDLSFAPTKATKSSHYCGTDGKIETIYLGVSKSQSFWRIYDKAREQKQKKKELVGYSWTRIERQLKQQGPLANIEAQKNPFKSLIVEDQHLPNPPFKGYVWALFQDSVKHRGLDNALALLPPTRRATVKKALKSNLPCWWNPDDIWKNWKSVLTTSGLLTDQYGNVLEKEVGLFSKSDGPMPYI